MSLRPAERQAMTRALDLATSTPLPDGPNPRVGCVLLAPDGQQLAEGHHRGAGTAHAEVDALTAAAGRTRGATAVVTLEPCNHTGRTSPCTRALIEAGIARVVFAQSDPNPVAAGGAATLAAAGVEVVAGVMADQAQNLNREWTLAVRRGRPFVTWKFAGTLDGYSAAVDGTSRWISSSASRADVHRLRGRCDAVLVGTGTAIADDPHLGVRLEDQPPTPPPLRVVIGLRALPEGSRLLDPAAPTLHLRTRDPHEVLDQLHGRDCRHVLLEGGPTVAAAFLSAGLVDEVIAYLAPVLLGAGRPVLADLGVSTLADALRLPVDDVTVIDPTRIGDEVNIRVTLRGPDVPVSQQRREK